MINSNGTWYHSDATLQVMEAWNTRYVLFDSSEWILSHGTDSFEDVISDVVELLIEMDTSWRNDGSLESMVDNIELIPHINQLPTAFVDGITPNPAEEGDTVTFSGHGTDTDGSIVGYYWSSSSAGSLSTDSSFSTCSLSVGTDTIYFRVQDDDSAWSEEVSEILVIQVGVEDEEWPSLPDKFSLSQNYPNPFNPLTEIKYTLPKGTQVKLEVYNLLGHRVAILVDGHQKAGYKTVNWNASSFTSGIYFYRLQDGDCMETKRMILLK